MKTTILFTLLLIGLWACHDQTLGPEPTNTPEANFDRLWQDYDRMYGLFAIKKVDWSAVYQRYRPLVKNGMSNGQFFTVVSSVLSELNDGHVWMVTPEANGSPSRRYDSGPTYATGDFEPDVVRSYLQNVKSVGTAEGINVVYGTLPGTIGYVHFVDFGQSLTFYQKAMDDILTTLGDTKGLIVDIRNHGGGDDRVSQYIAGRFATDRNRYMTSRLRSGPGHADYTPATDWYVSPTGTRQYTKPVALLTNRITESAGETFTLAMNQIATVTQMGDTTFGIFSETTRRELPNGWIYTISVGDYRAADGRSYEGVGIAPAVVFINRPEDVAAGTDKLLEAARLRLLR